MASRERKTIGFRTEEELVDAVNETVNDSDSDTEGCYTQGRIKLFGAPRQRKHFRPLFQTTPRLPVPRQK